MIVRNEAGRDLMDREALALWCNRPQITIRRHCRPAEVDRDPSTGATLYDAEQAATLLGTVPPRPGRRKPRLTPDR
jgi:hypothetical protein